MGGGSITYACVNCNHTQIVEIPVKPFNRKEYMAEYNKKYFAENRDEITSKRKKIYKDRKDAFDRQNALLMK